MRNPRLKFLVRQVNLVGGLLKLLNTTLLDETDPGDFLSQHVGISCALADSKTRKSPLEQFKRAFLNNPGDFLLSHAVTRAVPSAPAGLTSVFGMGTSN